MPVADPSGAGYGVGVRPRRVWMLLFLLAFAACGATSSGAGGDSDPRGGGDTDGPAPDFALLDVNTTSATYDTSVSPRDYLDKVSAWYFGHAT